MPDGLRPVHQAASLQVVDDFGVRLLDEHSGERLDFRLEPPLQVDDVTHRDALPQAEFQVIDAVGGGRVHDARAVLDRDEIGIHDEERRLVRDQVSIEGFVALAEQALGTAHRGGQISCARGWRWQDGYHELQSGGCAWITRAAGAFFEKRLTRRAASLTTPRS